MDLSDVENIIGKATNLISSLHPAFAILQVTVNVVNRVKYSKQRCLLVVRHAGEVLHKISDEFKKNNHQPGTEQLSLLQDDVRFVQDLMEKQANIGFLAYLLRSDDIKDEIDEAYRRLDDCLKYFSIRIELKILRRMEEVEISRQEDTASLRNVFDRLLRGHNEILRTLNLRGNIAEDEAMVAMQKKLKKTKPSTAIEPELLKEGLKTLQTTTGRSIPEQPDWAITSYDLDIEDELESEIGAGGFSTVMKGNFRGTIVAVKYFKKTSPGSLKQEVDIWSRLRNDYIVPFYHASITSDPPFVVSRYMRNGNLNQYLRLKEDSVNRAQLLHEVSLGMRYLHGEDIMHGDLKGVNVLIDDAGIACIADFGLSQMKRSSQARDTSETYLGTLRFMAPEAIRDGSQTFETDVYAFGMLIYETFTGDPPFYLETDAAVRRGDLQLSRPPGAAILTRGLTDEMWELLCLCISREPPERPTFTRISGRIQALSRAYLVIPGESVITARPRHDETRPTLVYERSSGTNFFMTQSSLPIYQEYAPSDSRSLSLPPFRLEITMRYINVEMGLSDSREPVVIRQEDHTFNKIHQGKPSFIESDKKQMVCVTEKETEIWDLSEKQVSRRTPTMRMLFEFEDHKAAQKWFEIQVQYAKGARVSGWSTPHLGRGTWSWGSVGWRRIVNGAFHRAPQDETKPDSEPSEKSWRMLEMPYSCDIDAQSAMSNSFSLSARYVSPTMYRYWRYRLEERTVIREARRAPTDRYPCYLQEEMCDKVEDAKAWFDALRTALEGVGSVGQ